MNCSPCGRCSTAPTGRSCCGRSPPRNRAPRGRRTRRRRAGLERAVPAELEIIVLKALEKNPADRYATAQELAGDLRRFLEDRPIQARRPTWRQRLRRWGRRHQSLVWSAGVAAALLL